MQFVEQAEDFGTQPFLARGGSPWSEQALPHVGVAEPFYDRLSLQRSFRMHSSIQYSKPCRHRNGSADAAGIRGPESFFAVK
jgi:hypothetical protein